MPDNPYLTSLLGGRKPAASTSELDDETEARVQKYSELNGVDPDLTRRLVHQESGGKNHATSWAGARGLMQLGPGTQKRFGVTNPDDPDQNLDAGTKYLRQHLDEFGDPQKALAAYNAGEGAVRKYGYDKVRRFSNFPKGDKRRGGYAGSTGEYVDNITKDYAGDGYHPGAKRKFAANLEKNPYFSALTGQTGQSSTSADEVQTSEPAVNNSVDNSVDSSAPADNFAEPETPEQPAKSQPQAQRGPVRVPVKQGMQSIDVLREGLAQKAKASGLDDKRAKDYANDALAEIVRAGKNPGLDGVDESRMQDLVKHGYAEIDISDPAYDEILKKYQEDHRAEAAEKQLKVREAHEKENSTIKAAIADPKKITNDLRWHFGVNDMAEFSHLPIAKQRKMIRLAAEAAANDEKKKAAGQTLEPSLEYQNLMRARVGLADNPALIDPRVPMKGAGKFSFTPESVQQLLNVRPTESYAPGYNPHTGNVESREVPYWEKVAPGQLSSTQQQEATLRDFGFPEKSIKRIIESPPEQPRKAAGEIRPSTFTERASLNIHDLIEKYAPGIASLNTQEGIKTNVATHAIRQASLSLVDLPEYEGGGTETANLFGDVAGALIPYVAAGKVIQLVSQAPRIARFLQAARAVKTVGPTLARSIQTGSLFGGVSAASQGVKAIKGESGGPVDATKQILTETGLGATIGILTGDNPNILRHIAAFVAPTTALAAMTGETHSPVPITGQPIVDTAIFNALIGLATYSGPIIEPLADRVIASNKVPEWAREVAAKATGKTPGIFQTAKSADGEARYGSVYLDPNNPDGSVVVREVAKSEADALLKRGRPITTVADRDFENIFGAAKEKPIAATPDRQIAAASGNAQENVPDVTEPNAPVASTSPANRPETKPENVPEDVHANPYFEQLTGKENVNANQERSPETLATGEPSGVGGRVGSGNAPGKTARATAPEKGVSEKGIQAGAAAEEEIADVSKAPTAETQAESPATSERPPAVPESMQPDRRKRQVQNLREERRVLKQDRRDLQRQAETDDLTELANQRAWKKALPAAEADPDTTVLTGDVNNMKAANDAEGHDAGDALIVKAARAMQQAAEEAGESRVFRSGIGDEISAIVPNDKAEKIRARAEELFGTQKAGGANVSLSVGHGEDFKAAEADLAPRKQKAKGETEEEAKPAKHEFSSTQVNLPKEIADEVKALASRIPDRHLAEDGREENPHTTVKFGLHTNDVADVKRVLEGEAPIKVKIGDVSTFPPSDSSNGAEVLKLDVDSPDLHRLNKKLSDALPHTDTFKYKPHITLAYVKTGQAKKYVGKKHSLQGREITVDSIAFSSKDREMIEIPLKGTEAHPEEKATPRKGKQGASEQTAEELAPEGGPADETKKSAEEGPGAAPASVELVNPEHLAHVESQTVKTERGTEARIKPAVIDAKDIITSLDEGYPKEFQPRDRTRAASREQISRIANNLEPDFLGDSPKASEGRPLVIPIDVAGKTKYAVISGNGRSEGIREAYSVGKADSYRKFAASKAEEQDESEGAQPVYVGVLHGDQDWVKFAREANESGVARMSAVEQAGDDANAITPELMAKFYPSEDGDVNTAANRDFIRAFVQDVAGTDQRGQLLTDDGRLSVDGVNRVRNAIFAKAYGGSKEGLNALAKMAEDPDNNIRQITNALLVHAGGFAELKENIVAGQRHDLDISEDLVKAAAKLSALREDGMTVETYLRQGSMFGEDLDTLQRRVLVVLNENKRSTRAINNILDNYLRGANVAGNPSQAGMWDAVNLTPSIEPLWDAAINQTKEVTDEAKRLLGLAGEATAKPRIRKDSGSVRAADKKEQGPKGTSGAIVDKPKREPKPFDKALLELKANAEEVRRNLAELKGLKVGDRVEMEAPIAGGLGGSETIRGEVKQAKSGHAYVKLDSGPEYSAFDNPWQPSTVPSNESDRLDTVDEWQEVKEDLGDDGSLSALEKMYADDSIEGGRSWLESVLAGQNDAKQLKQFCQVARGAGVSDKDIEAIVQEGLSSVSGGPLFKLAGENGLERLKQSDDGYIKSVADLIDRRSVIFGGGEYGQVGVDNLIRALDKLAYLRSINSKVTEYRKQDTLFSGVELTSIQDGMLEAFERYEGKKRTLDQVVTQYLESVHQGVAEFKGEPKDEAQQAALFLKAFHGSPYTFDQFSTTKIGSGEGAQSYGWGLYFAGKKEVADFYAKQLGPGRGVSAEDIAARIYESLPERFTEAEKNAATIKELRARLANAKQLAASGSEAFFGDVDAFEQTMKAAVKAVEKGAHKPRGYEVELAPKEDEYLHWDKPLGEQSETVKEALRSVLGVDALDSHAIRTLEQGPIRRTLVNSPNGGDIYSGLSEALPSARDASKQLHAAGVRGIKYLDQGSRAEGNGTYNYVIFDDADVAVQARYRREPAMAKRPDVREALSQIAVERYGHRLKLNSQAYQLLAAVYEQIEYERTGIPSSSRNSGGFSGVFNDRKLTAAVIQQLRKVADQNPAERNRVAALARAFKSAAGDAGMVIVYTKEGALIHEGFHRASEVGADGKGLFYRHARFNELLEHPAFDKAATALEGKGYAAGAVGNLIEESAAYIWDGEHEKLGLTEDEAADFLDLWFKSYTEANGEQSLEVFERERQEAQQLIDAAGTAAGTSNQRRQDAEGLAAGRQERNQGAPARDEAAEGPLFKRDDDEAEDEPLDPKERLFRALYRARQKEYTPRRVTGSRSNVESDRGRGPVADADWPAVSTEPGTAESGAPARSGETGVAGSRPAGGARVPGSSAPARGAGGDRELQGPASGEVRLPESSAAGDQHGAGSGPDLDAAAPFDGNAASPTERAAHKSQQLRAKRAAQRAADSIPVKVGDAANIAETLPFLYPHQHDNVQKAEERFAKPDGFAQLFTDGTGTGKTYTGLGLVCRYARQGKDNILITAPNDKIIEDWIRSAENLNLSLRRLDNTKDNGRKGIVITTYANFGQNPELVKRKWDLIVSDEAHNLGTNQSGEPTLASDQLRAITMHPDGAWFRQEMFLEQQYKELADLQARIKAYEKGDFGIGNETLRKTNELKDRREELIEEIERLGKPIRDEVAATAPKDRTRAVMLSATPFSYQKSVRYAQNFLFDWNKDFTERSGYNQPSAEQNFFITHLGWRMRTGKLTQPDVDVNSDVMEQELHEWLKNQQKSLSSYKLQIDADYSRNFVLVDDAIGRKIDEGLEWLNRAEDGHYRPLYDLVSKNFGYLQKMFLLESLKAKNFVPIIKQHLALGRKVLVVHDFNKGGGFHPFQFDRNAAGDVSYTVKGQAQAVQVAELVDEFEKKRPDLVSMDFSGLKTPIETMQEAFGDDAMFFNGRIPAKRRSQSLALFNADDSGKNLLIAQSDAAKEGINAHDTTGRHQRVTINLGMPVRPTKSIQLEGRTRRDGAVSDAVYLYGTTGTNFETWTFAHTISERTGTAENLGMGAQARALREAFVDAYENAIAGYEASADEGKGGKEADARREADISPYERAKTYYFGQRKRTSRDKSLEGVDYFATPEPIGFKMVEWADPQPGDYLGEPSAGHGAIARFFPPNSHRTMIEPSMELAARLGLVADGRIINGQFEDLHVTNKFDALVMNPPFGTGGKTAIDHVAKAVTHLRNGGRIVALIPEGPAADKKWEKFYSERSKDIYQVADIKLPSVVFERAGTSVRSHIVVLEKQTGKKNANQIQRTELDFSAVDNIKELFEKLEHVELPPRIPVPEELKEAPIADQTDQNLQSAPTGPAPKETERFVMREFKHTQTGAQVYAATPKVHLGDHWGDALLEAKHAGGYYSKYKQGGAIAGFLFPTDQARALFLQNLKETDIGAGEDTAGLGELGAPTRLPANALVRTQQRIEVAPLPGGEPKAPQQIIVDFDKALGHRTVIGKMGRGQAGSYSPASSKTAIRYSGDLDTAAHEISHQLDDRFGIVKAWAGSRQRSPFDGELIPRFSQFGVTSKKASLQEQRAEAVAEWVRALVANPGAAKGAAPLFYEHFMKMVPASVRKSLGDFSIKVREFAGLPATQRTSANIEQLNDRRPTNRSMTLLGDLNKTVNDSLAPLMKGIIMAKEMRGIDDIGSAHDPETLVRLVAGYNDKYLDMIKNGLRDAEGKPVTKGGVKWLLEPLATHKETLPGGSVVSRDATRAELAADMRDTMVLIVSERVLEKAGHIQALADEKISSLDQSKPTYAAAKKRIQNAADLRKARLAGTGGGIYADDKQAEEALYELFGDQERLDRLKEAAERYRLWMDAGLRYWVDKGRLSQESYERIREKNEYYGSFQRLAETIDAQYVPSFLGRSSKKLGSSYKGIYQFKGSTRRIQNLYLSLLDQTYRFYKEADRNFALRAFTELLTTDRKMHQGEVQDLARVGYETKQGDKNSITVWADGKRKVWKFAPEVFNALKGWGEVDDPNIIYRILQIPARLARSTIVRSPYFLARHLVRYSLHRSVVSEVGGKPWDILAGYSKGDLSMYRNMGGGMGGFDATGRDAYRKTMKLAITELAKDKNTILTVPGKLWRGYNSLVHQADMRVRMAEYRRAYQYARKVKGFGELDAATYAAAQSRALLDWAIAGTATRKISKYVPFVAPRVQGIAASARSFRRSPGSFLARWALYVLIPTLLTYLWNRAHGADTLHEYQEKPSYERDFFWNFKITSNRWIRVAKPYELGVLASGAERLLDYVMGNKHALEGWPADFVKALTPLDESNAIAGPFHAAAEIATNYDFFRGRNIVPPDEADKDLDLRKGTTHASRVGQWIQKAVGVDARYIDHTIAGSTGDLGRMALDVSDIGRGDKKQSLAGLFTAESPAYGAPDVQFVYDRARGRGEMNSLPMRMLAEQMEAWRDARTDGERDAKAKIVRDSAAELRKHFEGKEASVLGAYLPKPLSAEQSGAVDREMNRLNYVPKFVGENFKIDGEEVKLAPAQFHDYAQRVGEELYDGYGRLIKHPDYKTLSDEEKVKAMELWSEKIRDLEMARLKHEMRPDIEDVERSLDKLEAQLDDRDDLIETLITRAGSGKFRLKPRPKKITPLTRP